MRWRGSGLSLEGGIPTGRVSVSVSVSVAVWVRIRVRDYIQGWG